jgi:hypothetical protein
MGPSRFWLRRDADDRARQLVYDPVQLGRYSDRQKRAILKLMARGKTATHRDIRQAARRARQRPRGERLAAFTLILLAVAALVIIFADWQRGSGKTQANGAAASAQTVDAKADRAQAGDLTRVMENADRAWLDDVGAGKVVTATDGSDALSLPETRSPDTSVAGAHAPPTNARRSRPHPQH